MWFDSHCHLHLCGENGGDLDAIVARARDHAVVDMVTVGIDAVSSRRAVEIAERYGVWAAVGVHPTAAESWGDDEARAIEELAASPQVVAIGETGLDFYRKDASPQSQEVAFRAHVDLAKRTDKALVIHTRASASEALDVLEDLSPPPRCVFHCWSADKPELQRALELGAFVSFAGNVSFRNAGELRDLTRMVPAQRLLVETDSPYLAPGPRRGRPNEPANVALVGRSVAQARGEDEALVAATSAANACYVFGLA